MTRLAGKVALVVGAGQSPGETEGNGRAIARRFAAEGARVACADRDLSRAQETAAAIGEQAFAVACDVTRRADCDAAVAAVLARWERLDVLVNNVGIGGGGDGPAHRFDEAAFDRIMAVNLKGTVNGIAAALPAMRAAERGAIVNISSLAARAGQSMIAYELSKAAVDRLTRSTALANAARGVRVNAVAPGLMDTPMAIDAVAAARGLPREQVRAERDALVPLGKRMGTAADTAAAALFLASDEARFVTGVVLAVDGGMGARIG